MPRLFVAIGAVSFGTALMVIDSSVATVALPTIASELRVDRSATVMIVTIYQLVLVMTLLPFSALGDRLGHRRLYAYGQILFTVASVACLFAENLPFLLVVRAIQALGAAASLSVSAALIRSIYPPARLGRGLSLNSIVVSSSVALAPTLGGLILSVAEWRWVFAVAAPLGVISLLLGRALPEPRPRIERFDLLGAALCAAMFGLLIGGLDSLMHGGSPLVSATVLATGVALGVAFVRRELGEERPIMPVDLLAHPVLRYSIIAALVSFLASMSLFVSMPFRLQQYGFAPGEIGAMIAAWPVAMIFVSPLAGVLMDRYPAERLGGIGMAIAAIALVSLALLPTEPDHWDIVWRMALCGTGFGLFVSPNARLIVGHAPRERVASAGGFFATTRLTGQTLGAALVAALLAYGLGTGPAPALIAAGLAIMAGIFSLAGSAGRVRKADPGRGSIDAG